jgi:hypothetical protein
MLQKMMKPAAGQRRASVFAVDVLKHDGAEDSSGKTQRQTIRAELIGDDICTAIGITARSSTPVLQICRQLIAAGHDPATPLHAHRGDVLCLIIRAIGEAATLEANGNGTGFRRHRETDAAPPMRQKLREAP